MSTDVKSPQGRHRATVSRRTAPPAAAVTMLFSGAGVVLAALIVVWQVV